MKLRNYLNESSLSRVRQHMLDHDTGTITAFRYARDCGDGEVYTKKENKQRNKKLLAMLQTKGYSCTKVKGTYIENYGSDNAKEVGENVFFVVDINDTGKLEKDLRSFGEEFEQDSILFIPKGSTKGELVGTNHCEDSYPGYNKKITLKNPVFGTKGEFFTKVNGRPFILKENMVEINSPQNTLGKYAMSLIARSNWEDV